MAYDCIIILANEMDRHGNLNAESTSRVQLAVDCYKKEPSATLITCGWDYRADSDLCIGDVMKAYAEELGVPSDKIIAELNSRDTVGDAFFTKLNLLSNHPWKDLLVVTSDYHVDRAHTIFKFVCGPNYNVKVLGAGSFDSPEKQNAERASLEAFEQTFAGVSAGDIKQVYQQLSTRHPFYNGEVYRKIDIEF